jgi:uracil-DNA glycosylase
MTMLEKVDSSADLDHWVQEIRGCKLCLSSPNPLPHEPRPVLRVSSSARLLVAGQAPGVRVNNTGIPFNDASGDRLREWMGVTREVFYDNSRIDIVGMGFCFPGHDAAKGDLPPRPECRATWHDRLFELLPRIGTILAIGRYAQDYHFARLGHPLAKSATLDEIVASWREHQKMKPHIIALPHPSWRNSGWLKRHPWFEAEVLPMLRKEVAKILR